jgi:hypothetical protein
MSRGNWGAPALLAGVALSALSGCAGKIHSFTLSKQFICPAEPLTLTWKTTGTTTLTAEPPVDGLGKVSEAGSRDVTVQGSTVFTLKAARTGGTATQKQEVALGEGRDQAIGGETQTCDASGISTTFTVAAEDWDERLRVTAVDGSLMGRPLTIVHAGKTVDLTPGVQGNSLLAGERISGEWTIRAPLVGNEQCGVQDSGIPASISLKVRVGCGGGSP